MKISSNKGTLKIGNETIDVEGISIVLPSATPPCFKSVEQNCISEIPISGAVSASGEIHSLKFTKIGLFLFENWALGKKPNQCRFPKSKKKRIRKKWSHNIKNWKDYSIGFDSKTLLRRKG